ncbi:excinuclease ABC subunit C [Serratia symbiotica str. 'Cinara cedri']|nr:excinuclease ABC subunit C [Serratia symbiotica str. 'Cinara cedri']
MNDYFNAKSFLQTLTSQTGVYRMYDNTDTVIYVGKAKNLKKRLSSYFRQQIINSKTEILVKNITQIDITITHSETEALLLEHNYIKEYQPRYNVLLRDDKSYPLIFISADRHPRIAIYRGTKRIRGEYFGPFPNFHAVRETLILLQKIFPIRQCENSVYRNRSRPCLQYQIKRCLGPCVDGFISDEEYLQQVEYVRLFLSGKDQQVLGQLINRMERASNQLNFEEAAKIRDQIKSVRSITERQFVSGINHDVDVISIAFNEGIVCLHVLFIRQGNILGSRSYFPEVPCDTDIDEVTHTFFGQFYLHNSQERIVPSEIILDFNLSQKKLLITLLCNITGRKIKIWIKPCGNRARYLTLARTNAAVSLANKLAQQSTFNQRLDELAKLLKIPVIKRMECLDISHTMGEQTVGSCVVFSQNGPLRSEYRRYNITGITPGDDYAAIAQTLKRRYSKVLKEKNIPDIIFIDGGKPQLSAAIKALSSLNLSWNKNKPLLIGIAKGNDRKVGVETLFFVPEGKGISLRSDSLALHMIQKIRNDAHNYAIIGHRHRRAKVRNTSSLELIEGIGPKRRQLLLKYMGGLRPLLHASIEEIARVPGISHVLAEKIYKVLKH